MYAEIIFRQNNNNPSIYMDQRFKLTNNES